MVKLLFGSIGKMKAGLPSIWTATNVFVALSSEKSTVVLTPNSPSSNFVLVNAFVVKTSSLKPISIELVALCKGYTGFLVPFDVNMTPGAI